MIKLTIPLEAIKYHTHRVDRLTLKGVHEDWDKYIDIAGGNNIERCNTVSISNERQKQCNWLNCYSFDGGVSPVREESLFK